MQFYTYCKSLVVSPIRLLIIFFCCCCFCCCNVGFKCPGQIIVDLNYSVFIYPVIQTKIPSYFRNGCFSGTMDFQMKE